MKGLHRIQWFSIFLLASCLTACQVKRPKVVISDAKMENAKPLNSMQTFHDFFIA